MSVDEVGANGTQTGGRSSLTAQSRLADDFDAFLDLLVTQMQNQDPLEPMEPQEFTNQLVQFASVEQALATNDKLDQLVGLQSGNQAATAAAFIGHEVKATGDQVMLDGGSARIGYELDDEAKSATIEITSSEGTPVRTLQLDGAAGSHEVVWDGRNDNGNAVADGVYTITLSAVNENDQTVQGRTTTFGTVSGFEIRDNDIVLNIGDLEVDFDKVRSVREAGG